MENKNSLSEREKIANRIRDARIMAGLSQAQAAEKLNLQRPSISEMESGKRKVSAEEIIQIAGLYRVDIAWLLSENSSTDLDIPDHVKFAARELNKLKPDEMNKIIDLIRMLPKK